tara:strand:- start:4874 stop:5113 length:240 start_codon:yes stop_codon:yes gene_type:complete
LFHTPTDSGFHTKPKLSQLRKKSPATSLAKVTFGHEVDLITIGQQDNWFVIVASITGDRFALGTAKLRGASGASLAVCL